MKKTWIPERGGSLAEAMKGINLLYVQHYRRRYGYMGYFWQDRQRKILISMDHYHIVCGSYVELSPVRAEIVRDPKEYRWSSYKDFVSGMISERGAMEENLFHINKECLNRMVQRIYEAVISVLARF